MVTVRVCVVFLCCRHRCRCVHLGAARSPAPAPSYPTPPRPLQEAACVVLEALAAVKPHVVAAEVNKVHDRFRSKHYCDRVLAACRS